MPWHLPEDLAHFKRTTMHHPVIMGRKTWDSIPVRFRPLPGRTNIVVTRSPDWEAPGAIRAASLEAALSTAREVTDAECIWITGGGEIFRAAMPYADELVVTRIDAEFPGDTHAPVIGPEWCCVDSMACASVSGPQLHFETWQLRTARNA